MAETGPHGAKLDHYARHRRALERGLSRAIKEPSRLKTGRTALIQQHPAVVQGSSEGAPLAEITRLTNNTREFFSYENYRHARKAREPLARGVEHAIEVNRDLLAEFEEDEAAQNEADLAGQTGLPLVRSAHSYNETSHPGTFAIKRQHPTRRQPLRHCSLPREVWIVPLLAGRSPDWRR